MTNRLTRGAVALTGALLTFGAVSMMLTTAAGAAINTSNAAGYQAGNGAWSFRYVQTTFTVPELACTGQDDFLAAGAILQGSLANATVGVACDGSVPQAGWGTTSLTSQAGGSLAVHGDDNITVAIYYDQTTGYDYFYATDNTTGASATWAHKAGVAEYHYALTGAYVNNPLQHPPAPGSNFVLVPFTGSTVTSYDGTRGTGLNGPWGGATELQAVNGAHVIAAAPALFKGGSTFNVRVYGNA
jgi:hypothetical protein